MGHGLAHKGGFFGALAALQQGAGVDGLDDKNAAGHGFTQAQRHAFGVDQQAAALGQSGQRLRCFGVRRHVHVVIGQGHGQGTVNLARADKQSGVFAGDEQVRQEDRVVGHITAAQVGDPSNVVHGGDKVRLRAVLGHGAAHRGQFVAARP